MFLLAPEPTLSIRRRVIAQRPRFVVSKLERAATYPGLEIIAKLATVLEVEPGELLRVPPIAAQPSKGKGN
jgi:hypothetical protein